jgi:hypothetical protein
MDRNKYKLFVLGTRLDCILIIPNDAAWINEAVNKSAPSFPQEID